MYMYVTGYCKERQFQTSGQSQKKGQFSLEYLAVLTLFLVFSLYFAFRLLEYYPLHLKNVREEILRSDSYRLSEMMINDDGWPTNWETLPFASVERIGLSDATEDITNLLAAAKVNALDNLCHTLGEEYPSVKRLVGAEHDFFLEINNTSGDGSLYTQCGPLPASGSVSIIRRIVAFDNGDYGELVVQMWW